MTKRAVHSMDEVKFLYDCVKAGKLSNDQAKSLLSTGTGESSSKPASARPVATAPARNEAGASLNYVARFMKLNGCILVETSRKADLMAKYKAIQKAAREESVARSSGQKKPKATSRSPLLMKVRTQGLIVV